MTQLPSKSSGQAAYEAVLTALSQGVYRPGDRLRETEVAGRLSLSRTPVREAIRRLEADGIVEHRPRVGAVIHRLEHGELVELYEMRAVLERTAAEMAARHGAEAEFARLEELNADIAAEQANPSRAAAINQAFHRTLYLACRNRYLLKAARALNNSLILLGPTTFTEAGRIAVVVAEHEAIIEALRARDPATAGQAAAAHLQTSLQHRLRVLGA